MDDEAYDLGDEAVEGVVRMVDVSIEVVTSMSAEAGALASINSTATPEEVLRNTMGVSLA